MSVRACAVDAVIIKDDKLCVILRNHEPFEGHYVLPGGFVDPDETIHEAVRREVQEETGLTVKVASLVGIYSEPSRDPRQNISIAYLCQYVSGKITDSEEGEVEWWDLDYLPPLGFDHDIIVKDALEEYWDLFG